jgi:hypothetical protein
VRFQTAACTLLHIWRYCLDRRLHIERRRLKVSGIRKECPVLSLTNVTELALDAAFFASLEEPRYRAEQAIEESIRLRTGKSETHKYRMERWRASLGAAPRVAATSADGS